MSPLSPEAMDALRRAEVTASTVVFPDQLPPKVYAEVKKVVERSGGKWNRSAKAHLFVADPRPRIAELLGTGAMPRDATKDAAFFRTPSEIVGLLLTATGPFGGYDVRVLEPSAGDGAIAEQVRALAVPGVGDIDLVCVEPDPQRHAALLAKGFKAEQMTFEDFAATEPEPFDSIVMNPPFATPGHPVLWAEHVLLAYDLLVPGGSLAAIVPNNLDRAGAAVRRVRSLVEDWGDVEPLSEGSFKESGTGVRTALLTLELWGSGVAA